MFSLMPCCHGEWLVVAAEVTEPAGTDGEPNMTGRFPALIPCQAVTAVSTGHGDMMLRDQPSYPLHRPLQPPTYRGDDRG